jgi:hypothetical protein
MLASAIRVRYETLRSVAFGAITNAFVALGTPFANPVRMLKITNRTDQDMLFSYDGVNPHDIVPAMSSQIYDYASNKINPADALEQSKQTQMYIKYVSAPGSGSVYVTCIYASTN